MLHTNPVFSFAAISRALGRLARLASGRSNAAARLRGNRAELAHMSARELNDLGIGRGEIPALLDDPLAWRRDRR